MMRFIAQKTKKDLGDLTLKKPVGSGGAGDVYIHPSLPNQCIKIYKRERDHVTNRVIDHAAAHEAKVRAMLANPPDMVITPDGTVQMAWPQDAVIDESGTFRGFVMPFIDFNASWGMNQVLNAKLRSKKGIPDALVFRLTAAVNLALLIDLLHKAGHYIIDVKPQNMRIYGKPSNKAGFVALLDCDGFFISEGPGKRTYPATLATPEYANPNGISSTGGALLDWMNKNPREQDLWSLSVLTFLLLNEIHPLQGVPHSFPDYPTELPVLAKRHTEVYAYGIKPNPRVEPKAGSLHEWFSPDLRALFDRTFAGNLAIPPAREWLKTLNGLRRDERQYQCLKNPEHWKLGDVCGQCELERSVVSVPLPRAQVAAPISQRQSPSQPQISARPVYQPSPASSATYAPPTQPAHTIQQNQIQPPLRKVGITLFLGVLFFPYLCVWFLMRAGHSAISRAFGFGWFAFWFATFMLPTIFGNKSSPPPAPKGASVTNTTPAVRQPASVTNQSNNSPPATVNTPLAASWIGTWSTVDGSRFLSIDAQKIKGTDRYITDGKGMEESSFTLNFVPLNSDVQFERVSITGGSGSAERLRANYEAAVQRVLSGEAGEYFGVDLTKLYQTRTDFSKFKSGSYQELEGYLGGDCSWWKWYNDGNHILEVMSCEYGHSVNLLSRSTESASRQTFLSNYQSKSQSSTNTHVAAQVGIPTIKPGDKFEFEVSVAGNVRNSSTYRTSRRVVATSGSGVVVSRTQDGSSTTRTLVYDQQWNLVETEPGNPSSGLAYSPALRYFDFPLYPGKKWSVTSTETNKKTGETRLHTLNGEVEAWDRNIGIFGASQVDGLRIKLVTSLRSKDTTSESVDTSWYVPAAGGSVYSTITGQSANGDVEARIIRRTDFSPGDFFNIGSQPTRLTSPTSTPIFDPVKSITDSTRRLNQAARSSASGSTSGSSVSRDAAEMPAYRKSQPPRYPPQALRKREQGDVILRVLVSEDGHPLSVEVQKSSRSRLLDKAAVDAVRGWMFLPAVNNGQQVRGYISVPISFRLDGSG